MAENEEADGWYRRFVILRLSSAELADEEHWHTLFRQHVGTHTDYDDALGEATRYVRPREEWDHFYVPFRARPARDMSSNEVVGWMEW